MRFLLLFVFLSCSALVKKQTFQSGQRNYSYSDVSGIYGFNREYKMVDKKLITRTQLVYDQGGNHKVLEKSITVSQLGTVKGKKARELIIRPFGSEFVVWLEGKKYESKMKLDEKNKSMILELDSPEEKWKGKSSIPFPAGKQFCFFSQIPDCLQLNLFLAKALERKNEALSFQVVWDSFPFIQDQFNGVGGRLFSPATLKFEGQQDSVLRFIVEVDGQSILYHFSKSFDLIRMLWISQGLSIIPPGEAANASED